jgi:hypothetical protein
MDYKFLQKVVDQIISETMIDYGRKVIETPFRSYSFSALSSSLFRSFPLFPIHCKEVYGLNEDEIEYVWKVYRGIIKDKIDNNGL